MSDYSEARIATTIAFKTRVTGPSEDGASVQQVAEILTNYEGDFDYQALAGRIELPATSKLDQHQRAWKVLWSEFEREWNLHTGRKH